MVEAGGGTDNVKEKNYSKIKFKIIKIHLMI